MPRPKRDERAERIERETARLRRRGAELAASLAATEEQVADTLEEVAEHRPAATLNGCALRPNMPGNMPLRNATAARSTCLGRQLVTTGTDTRAPKRT